jgi:hypothetical protein
MKSFNISYENAKWSGLENLPNESTTNEFILIFASRDLLEQVDWLKPLKTRFPHTPLVYCSTAGEINRNLIHDNTAQCSLLQFDATQVKFNIGNLKDYDNSFELGKAMAKKIDTTHLKHVLIFVDGQLINGDDLLSGIQVETQKEVLISGGVAGDGARFTKTLVGLNEDLKPGNVVTIALYGDKVRVGTAYQGGWDIFGVEKMITKSEGNVLHEIDQENALDLYKKYLGQYAEELPGSALLFPISIKSQDSDSYIVRTILSIDEKNKTMTFAGNVPEGSSIRFMKSSVDRLVQAASDAGSEAIKQITDEKTDAQFALLVSCVGRKLAMGSRAEEEVEAALEQLPANIQIAGFFSYGEIAPNKNNRINYLHNQTMTITTIGELP